MSRLIPKVERWEYHWFLQARHLIVCSASGKLEFLTNFNIKNTFLEIYIFILFSSALSYSSKYNVIILANTLLFHFICFKRMITLSGNYLFFICNNFWHLHLYTFVHTRTYKPLCPTNSFIMCDMQWKLLSIKNIRVLNVGVYVVMYKGWFDLCEFETFQSGIRWLISKLRENLSSRKLFTLAFN